MQLSDIAEPIFENVEKLLPHLRDDVKKYLALRKDAGSPNPSGWPRWGVNEHNLNKWIDEAVEWALRADPRYLRDAKKKKPLERIKAPFVRHILKWWLDPKAGDDLNLPEDIETTGEMLQKFNVAKQAGLNVDPGSFPSWGSLVETLRPYIPQGEELSSDSYSRMGLELDFNSGPWKMYLVDKWIPGDESTLHPGQVCHRAFEGTEWCVKYERTFTSTYSGNYYLVLRGGKRFALINFPSLQFKDPMDQQIGKVHHEEGAEFLQLLFAERPDYLAELALAGLGRNNTYGGALGDFTSYQPLFQDEIQQTLSTPEAKQAAERDPTHVSNLAKLLGEWPHFETWPEGYRAIIAKSTVGRNSRTLQELVEARGRLPEVEANLDITGFKQYVQWVSKANQPKEAVQDLINKGRQIAERSSGENLRSAIGWLSTERGLNQGRPDPWPEMEQIVLDSSAPRVAYAWARMMYNGRWEAGESLIAQDERASKSYEKLTGVSVHDPKPVDMEDPKAIVKRAMATGQEFEGKEDVILTDLDAAIDYAEHIIGPWPELEEKLEGDPDRRAKYRNNVLHGVF